MPEDLLSIEQISTCVEYAFPGNREFEILERLSGTINDVYRIRIFDTDYALRVRARERFFAYEQNIIKDVVVGRTLTALAGSTETIRNETEFSGIVDDTLERGCGGPIPSPISPLIVVYDHTRTRTPYLWMLQKWQSGTFLEKGNTSSFFQTGISLATLHSIRFKRFKTAITAEWIAGPYWTDVVLQEIKEKSDFLGINTDFIRDLPMPKTIESFGLRHNDLQPLNIIIAENGLAVFIDWDNMQIAPAELDLVKMKYWTVVNDNGYFAHSAEEYASFIQGYSEKCGGEMKTEVFKICELYWLLRVASFEKNRTSAHEAVPQPFPSLAYYLEAIHNLRES